MRLETRTYGSEDKPIIFMHRLLENDTLSSFHHHTNFTYRVSININTVNTNIDVQKIRRFLLKPAINI